MSQLVQPQPNNETHIEVQAPAPTQPVLNWTDIALGISNGSWAVLLTAFLLYLAFRGSVAKYIDKHLSLMDSLRKTLETHSYSIGALSDNHKETAEVIDAITKQLPVIQKTNEDVLELLEDIRDRYLVELDKEEPRSPWRFFR